MTPLEKAALLLFVALFLGLVAGIIIPPEPHGDRHGYTREVAEDSRHR